MNNGARSSRSCPASAFIAFGANLGEPAAAYADALRSLSELPHTRVMRQSSLYRTRPVGVTGQPDYLNAVIQLATALPPAELLKALLAIEHRAGRTRETHRAPRTLDLDLLLYDQQVIHSPGLEVPHPRMHERAFVLAPLTELAPEIHIPGHGPASTLLARIRDQDITKL